MNPHDLTGRDLDLAVTKALGYVWWSGIDFRVNSTGYVCLLPDDYPPDEWQRSDPPPYQVGSPWLPGYDCDGGRIPELFAEIRKRTYDCVDLVLRGAGHFAYFAASGELQAHGSTPNEALARLLLTVPR